MAQAEKKKLLIVVRALNKWDRVRQLISAMPLREIAAESTVLVVDDSSEGKAFEALSPANDFSRDVRVEVLSSFPGRGSGDDTRLGLQYAVEYGFDAVAVISAHGGHPPSRLPMVTAPVLAGNAEACYAVGASDPEVMEDLQRHWSARMLVRSLAGIQNIMLGTKLADFYCGYRAYSVAALKRIPFRYNTCRAHFDTEITIQLVRLGARIRELPVPSCSESGTSIPGRMLYVMGALKSLWANRMYSAGVFYNRRFDVNGDHTEYDIKLGYDSSHTMAIAAVKPDSTVLDIGCGQGLVARELARKGCRVTGVDRAPVDRDIFAGHFVHDLNAPRLPDGLGTYDYIMALDCIEHLDAPENFLQKLRRQCYSERTTLIFTTPNIGFVQTRVGLLLGRFNYTRQGILDFTHKRLFTFRSFRRLLESEGYEVARMRGVPAPFRKAFGQGVAAGSFQVLNKVLIAVWRAMFAYQILAVARFTTPVQHLPTRHVQPVPASHPVAAGAEPVKP